MLTGGSCAHMSRECCQVACMCSIHADLQRSTALFHHVFASLKSQRIWLCACRAEQRLAGYFIDSFSQDFERVVDGTGSGLRLF